MFKPHGFGPVPSRGNRTIDEAIRSCQMSIEAIAFTPGRPWALQKIPTEVSPIDGKLSHETGKKFSWLSRHRETTVMRIASFLSEVSLSELMGATRGGGGGPTRKSRKSWNQRNPPKSWEPPKPFRNPPPFHRFTMPWLPQIPPLWLPTWDISGAQHQDHLRNAGQG